MDLFSLKDTQDRFIADFNWEGFSKWRSKKKKKISLWQEKFQVGTRKNNLCNEVGQALSQVLPRMLWIFCPWRYLEVVWAWPWAQSYQGEIKIEQPYYHISVIKGLVMWMTRVVDITCFSYRLKTDCTLEKTDIKVCWKKAGLLDWIVIRLVVANGTSSR